MTETEASQFRLHLQQAPDGLAPSPCGQPRGRGVIAWKAGGRAALGGDVTMTVPRGQKEVALVTGVDSGEGHAQPGPRLSHKAQGSSSVWISSKQ